MLNHIVLMGRLTRDPELRYTQSQIPVASFRLAVDRDFGGRDGGERQTDFIDGGDTSRPAAPSASAPAHRGSYGGYDNVPQGGSAFSELDDDDGDLPF